MVALQETRKLMPQMEDRKNRSVLIGTIALFTAALLAVFVWGATRPSSPGALNADHSADSAPVHPKPL